MSDNINNKYIRHLQPFELHTNQLISQQATLMKQLAIDLFDKKITVLDFKNSITALTVSDEIIAEVETLNYIRNRLILIFEFNA